MSSLLLGIDCIEPEGVFPDSAFKITKTNYDVVLRMGLLRDLKIGDVITFVSAPGYFGDGYVMHMVAISRNGKTYLTFEAGFKQFS